MTQEQIHELETKLWDAADQLRASSKLTAAEYKDPITGGIVYEKNGLVIVPEVAGLGATINNDWLGRMEKVLV